MNSTTAWIIAVVFAIVFLSVAWTVRGKAGKNFAAYAVGGATLPLFLVMFTDLSTIMGAGNFVGEATNGFEVGYNQLAFVLGEQGSKIAFALIFAGFAGRFAYKTLGEMMHDLILRDKVSRIIIGILMLSLMIAYIGGQGLGMGLLFHQFTGVNPTYIILFFTALFIAWTYMGGMHAVARVEFLIGMLVVLLGLVYYGSVFSLVHFSPAYLNHRLAAVGASSLTKFKFDPQTITAFVTGLLGVMTAQIYWQRCFAAKNGKTARTGMIIAGSIAVIFVAATAVVGMVAKALNPVLSPSLAMPWLMSHEVPVSITVAVFALVLIAANGAAASNLNSAAVILINDFFKVLSPEMSDRSMLRWAKLMTVVIGAFGALAAMYASNIIALFSEAYTLLGGSVVPVLIVGLLWKMDYSKRFEEGFRNSRVSAWGARVGLVLGAVLAVSVNIFVGFGAAVVATIVVSLFTRGSTTEADRQALGSVPVES
ncbi:sodium:solute symporter family protein [Alicyclobacillus sp. ALC3]|uniref:sodium:solute symporter family protein n=1 Tax=Alicyclobacillus sp. ALC3 TaxID=2796143 RepID=UPI0023786DDA|nr:sodium:solute symporter family protein [Alicyclobacillus sp. ALC3]WDL98550.1 sodium:solute symporter family protein [Alicyclobacillus sp. ALC3]